MRLSKYSIELGVALSNQFPLNLDDYPIFDESYRQTLNDKIVRHYWFHEIGFETWDRFAHYLEVAMHEEMPYFNQLYKSELLKLDPLLTFSRTRTQSTNSTDLSTETATGSKTDNSTTTDTGTVNNQNNVTSTGQSENTSTASQDNKTETDRNASKVDNTKAVGVRSDTPPSDLGSIESALGNYATEATKNTGENATTENDATQSTETTASQSVTAAVNTDTTAATNETTTENVGTTTATTAETASKSSTKENTLSDTSDEHGFEVSQAELLLKYRETFLNIDMMVIDKLKDLFMAIY